MWNQFAQRVRKLEKKYAPKVYRALLSQVQMFTSELRDGKRPDTVLWNEQIGKVLRQMHIESAISEGKLRYRELKKTETKRLGSNPEWAAEVISRLAFHNARFVNSITETTRELLLKILSDGIEEGLSFNEIADKIDLVVEQTYVNRSFAIARTEIVRGSNMGTQMASEKYDYEVEKVWITAGDHRVRGNMPKDRFNHVVLNGKVVDSEDSFNNGQDIKFPGDPEASPGNTINCRCTIALRGKRDNNGNLIRKPSRLYQTI